MQVPSTPGASIHHILLIDENRRGLVARKAVLVENGYQVTLVNCADDLPALFAGEHFHLVVTDYKMPAMTGSPLIPAIRGAGCLAPIILISGYVEALGLNEANTGANIVIQKSSLEVPQLLHAVRTLLNIRKPNIRKPPTSAQPAPRPRKRRKA